MLLHYNQKGEAVNKARRILKLSQNALNKKKFNQKSVNICRFGGTKIHSD